MGIPIEPDLIQRINALPLSKVPFRQDLVNTKLSNTLNGNFFEREQPCTMLEEDEAHEVVLHILVFSDLILKILSRNLAIFLHTPIRTLLYPLGGVDVTFIQLGGAVFKLSSKGLEYRTVTTSALASLPIPQEHVFALGPDSASEFASEASFKSYECCTLDKNGFLWLVTPDNRIKKIS